MIDFRPILYVQGILLLLLAATMIIPLLLDLSHGHPDWQVFAKSVFVTAFAGGILMLSNQGYKQHMTIRQTFLFTTISYLSVTSFGAIPLYLSSLDVTVAEAFFEASSGLSTTGSTVLVGLDTMPPGVLLWRSLLNGIGGIGIVVMALAILPMLQIGGMQLFRTESSDTMDKMLPRTTQIAFTISMIFIVLVLLCAACFWIAGMSAFDAINHALATIATGGFSTYDASFGYFQSPLIEWIAIIFMIAGAAPLMLYFQMVHGNPYALLRNKQFIAMLVIIGVSVALLTIWQYVLFDRPLMQIIRHTVFSVVSVISTTGFVVTDYNEWGNFAIGLFFIITVIGGCTGSTAGGIKVFRFQILYETAKIQLQRLMHPHGIFIPRYNGQPITNDILESVMSFVILFGITFSVITVALTAFDLDFLTAMSSAAQAMSNVGPGLGTIVGPAGNFSTLPEGAKWILSFAMLIGRLELFTVLILLTPAFWRQ